MKTSGFTICGGKGFHIRLPNGLTLSTQFGGGNYGSNYDARIGREAALDEKDCEAETVELAVFPTDGSGKWLTQEIAKLAGLKEPGDDVIGYVPMEDWLNVLAACAAYKLES